MRWESEAKHASETRTLTLESFDPAFEPVWHHGFGGWCNASPEFVCHVDEAHPVDIFVAIDPLDETLLRHRIRCLSQQLSAVVETN